MTFKRPERVAPRLPSLLALALVAALAGCSSGVKLDDNAAKVESRDVGTGTGNRGASSGGTAESKVEPVDLTRNADAAGAAARVIYFDFDSFVVKDQYRPVIEGYSKRLAADRKKHIAVEGHTDERGGREYNLALGQKRAEAVAKSMTLLGAAENQVEAVSFGKERPAAQGNDEAAWAKNRRAEITDK